MNKNILNVFGVILIMIVLLILSGALYCVNETQQVVLTQFGDPLGDPITMAGLKFKAPWQTANFFEKRILQWDGDPDQIPTKDKRYIWVDTTARWRIIDALKYMQSVGSFESASSRLDDILDGITRDVISSNILVEVIRNSNRIVETPSQEVDDVDQEVGYTQLESVSVGRERISQEILTLGKEIVPRYGIELIDLRIKRINYIEDVQRKVYERMISERKRAAEKFRSEGQGKKAEIEGQMSKELQEIEAEAYRQAEEIKGKADAKAIKIYAEAYNKDPDFFSFVKSLETYRKVITSDTTLILSTDNELYRYLNGINPKQPMR
ncbi:MAG: protease modulator HflC [Candidatus Omnitrophica bacterium]|nr:protease modulator HflC [Candidatus Omnitrophota bacterium]